MDNKLDFPADTQPAWAGWLLARFAGTEAWLDEDARLPLLLSGWLAQVARNPDKRPLLRDWLALRHWPLLRCHIRAGEDEWDFRVCSFQAFLVGCETAGVWPASWSDPAHQPPGISLTACVLFLVGLARQLDSQECGAG
ncbi:MAG TPA: hypothetical protein PLE99_05810 [Candidatus Thiothrix moscowensis]|uniref:hypothetical protein n=1 Tax=unclassified Thiothrix TaxID=2636184 RepID=UPI0025DFAC8C|nr:MULTISPECIES: hypothetical protein [unclassified Thiothrix]HRJ52260.1 hypothetical protein [Candidatus Thiothrix moscowensis]HRJ92575.1 hypothetical protein [Candidatus Thiothrix moscowensis]